MLLPMPRTTHPHNFYAQMLAELGIIGFLTLLFFFLYITFLFIKIFIFSFLEISNTLPTSQYVYCFYFMTLFPFLPSGNFFNNWLFNNYLFSHGFFNLCYKER